MQVTADKNAATACYLLGSKSAFLCQLCGTKHRDSAMPSNVSLCSVLRTGTRSILDQE